MKILKPNKQLKNSKQVFEFFEKRKETEGIIPYKGGAAIVVDRKVREIYVGKDFLKQAKQAYD